MCVSVWSYQYRKLHKIRDIQVLWVHSRPELLQDVSSLLEEGAQGFCHLAKSWERPRRKHSRTTLKIPAGTQRRLCPVLSNSYYTNSAKGCGERYCESRPEWSKWVVFQWSKPEEFLGMTFMLLFTKFAFLFVEQMYLVWWVKQHPTTPCPDCYANQQVYIPLEAQGKDVNFLYPELCMNYKQRARVKSTTWLSAAEVTSSLLVCPV